MKKVYQVKSYFSGKGDDLSKALVVFAEAILEINKRLKSVEEILDRAPRDLSAVGNIYGSSKRKKKEPEGRYGQVGTLPDGTPVMGFIKDEEKPPEKKIEPLRAGAVPYKDD